MESTKVPTDIWAKIILSQNLSVSDLQNFPLPELAISKSPSPQPLQIFLSCLTPNITNVEEIIILQTSSEALLKNLLKCPKIRQSQSFVCEHLHGHTGLRVPLWTIGYWLEVLWIHPIKLLWVSAQRSLHFMQKEQLLTDNSMDLIKQVSSVLSKLSWKDNIKGFPVAQFKFGWFFQFWLSIM